MEEVMEVDFPVKFSVGTLRKVRPCKFTCDTTSDEFIVRVKCKVTRRLLFQTYQITSLNDAVRTLTGCHTLTPELIRNEKIILNDRITRRNFIHRRGTVTEPLTCHKDWHSNMKLKFNHLERRRVLMTHEVSDQRPIVID